MTFDFVKATVTAIVTFFQIKFHVCLAYVDVLLNRDYTIFWTPSETYPPKTLPNPMPTIFL